MVPTGTALAQDDGGAASGRDSRQRRTAMYVRMRTHPHEYGGQARSSAGQHAMPGASPRVRGSSAGTGSPSCRQKHPRRCGEQSEDGICTHPEAGASSRMRERHLIVATSRSVTGTYLRIQGEEEHLPRALPALENVPRRDRGAGRAYGSTRSRAGNIPGGTSGPLRRGHPADAGSSRGRAGPRCADGNTPANAESSGSRPRTVHPSRGHPRGCEEQMSWRPSGIRSVGTPPQRRGTEHHPPGAQVAGGNIPADAGSRRTGHSRRGRVGSP